MQGGHNALLFQCILSIIFIKYVYIININKKWDIPTFLNRIHAVNETQNINNFIRFRIKHKKFSIRIPY